MDQDNPNERLSLNEDERQLIDLYRRCTQRRQVVIQRFVAKLAKLEWPLVTITHQVITNILPFKRRKDD